MSEPYTPDTDRVRTEYVRALRDTFVASAGQLEAEFDRWLAARDTAVAVKTLEDAAQHLHAAGLREKRLNRQRAYGRGVQDAARTVRSYAAMLRLGRTL
jgi:hypothetical protein